MLQAGLDAIEHRVERIKVRQGGYAEVVRVHGIEAAARGNEHVVFLQQFQCEGLVIELAFEARIEALLS